MIYDNLNSSAVKSIEILEKTVKVVYNSNTDKEYTYNVSEYPDHAQHTGYMSEQFEIDLKKTIEISASVGKYLHQWVKLGWLYIPTDVQHPEPNPE